MSTRKQVVKVEILDEEYSLRSDASPEHTRAVAAHVDAAIRRVMHGGSVVETHKVAILAALQIADELFRTRAALGDAAGGIGQLGDEVRRWLPPDKRSAPEAG
ncbi:MAG: cell division protein ZapA [Gemmatimonadaceae bacterium]